MSAWRPSTPRPATELPSAKISPQRAQRTRRTSSLLDSDLLDQAQDVGFRHVVEWPLVFFFQPLAQKIRGDEAGFAVGQVAAKAFAEFHEGLVRQPQDQRLAIDKKFRVDGVRVARGNAVPHVRKPALKYGAGQLGSHLKGAHKGAHGAAIG